MKSSIIFVAIIIAILSNCIHSLAPTINIRRVSTDAEIVQAAAFLSQTMIDGVSSSSQLKELFRLEQQDLRKRYGNNRFSSSNAMKLRYPSCLLIAEENEEVIATVGMDCQFLNVNKKKFKMITENSITFQDDEQEPVLCLANLAVRRDKRKLGIGKQMMIACENYVNKELAQQSSESIKVFDEIHLLVDSENAAARKLYKKLGYTDLFVDEDATCIVSGSYNLQTQECINYCMKKTVSNKGTNSNLFTSLMSLFNR